MYQQYFSAILETIAGRCDKADGTPTNRHPACKDIVFGRFIAPT